jgi:hypothetical protein
VTTSCKPRWGFKNHSRVVRCYTCFDKKQACSFNNDDWNIAAYPKIERSEEGDRRRAEEARAKQLKANAAQVVADEEESALVASGSRVTRSRIKNPGPSIKPSVPSISVSPSPTPEQSLTTKYAVAATVPGMMGVSMLSPSVSFDMGPTAGGLSEQIFFENLARYEEFLRGPSRSLTELGVAVSDLETLMSRESGALAILHQKVAGRKRLVGGLIDRINQEIAKMSAPSPMPVEAGSSNVRETEGSAKDGGEKEIEQEREEETVMEGVEN